jgi:ubiquinone/menaquinone biosynthesis C-methylase UbiE
MEQQIAPRTHGLLIRWAAQYDMLAWLVTHGREGRLRERMISIAGLEEGESVLDIGCGTGTLAIAATRRVGPMGSVCGIDASPPMIARAIRKATRASAPVLFQVAVAEDLPFPNQRFDVVLSTLMLHHLPRNARQQCAAEIKRVLKVGGRVLAVDFGRAQRRGVLAHFHRHGHVDRSEMEGLLLNTGLITLNAGPLGMNNLHFVLAEVHDAALEQRVNV